MKHLLRQFGLLAILVALMGGIAAPAAAAPRGPTIVDVAIAVNSSGPYAGQFDTLIAAVLAADPAVLATLAGNGQYTVFAPTDDAFAKLGLTPENVGVALDQQTLTSVLLYHVSPGRRASNAVIGSKRINTLGGGFLLQKGGVLTDNQGRTSNIIVTDVAAANGIIHVIDTVVLP
ncbi:MAG TPA: fasciclin domain-containing protein [Roseiflexaceae bacterium]|nr:fasciclin domain-containing protein [Roseiflexaceae bacterium]HMP40734.1 fasciclin domain-containing protein [Roseiflexaceae bacterium]